MFERKNQNILSEHYNKMVDHSDSDTPSSAGGSDSDSEDELLGTKDSLQLRANDGDDGDDDDDFMTLKRKDHALPPSLADVPLTSIKEENMSKRKSHLLKSKKGIAKLYGSLGTKIVFDDEGVGRDAFREGRIKGDEVGEKEFVGGGADEKVREKGREFVMRERERLMAADVLDKAVAKEKKVEKKRKRKEREGAVCIKFLVLYTFIGHVIPVTSSH